MFFTSITKFSHRHTNINKIFTIFLERLNVYVLMPIGEPLVVPMVHQWGSPISGLLAEFKLRPLDNIILETIRPRTDYWFRYVDDVFIIWNHSKDELYSFLDKINMLENKIKFTLEIKQNQKLAFLDAQLIRNITKQNLDRTVFRKTNRSNATIPFDCSSPISYKLTQFNYYIKRAFEVCSSHLLKEELDAIRKIAIGNAIPSRFVAEKKS